MDNQNPAHNESEFTGYSLDDLLEVAASITKDIKEIRNQATQYLKKKRYAVEPEWLNSYETMQKLKICKKTLKRYRDNKLLRFNAFNGNFRYRYVDVLALINEPPPFQS